MASLFFKGEDCLYLNIWTKDADPAAKRPVMVWIHGGGFMMGGTVDPLHQCDALVLEHPDVVFVTISYRLGVFGFIRLSHLADGADYPDAQNLGLMDQLQALKWVHENIAGFGGDPGNVTIFGESAGGGSVTTLPLVKGSHKYFRRVIAQSGSPALTRSTEQSIELTNEFMAALGCETVADLKKVDVERLVEASVVFALREWPERDGDYLPLDTWEAYAQGTAADIDILQGCNKDEMGYFITIFGGLKAYDPWAQGRKEHKLAELTDEEWALVEDFCACARDTSAEYSATSRLFDQIMFIDPLFRTAELHAASGGRSFVCYSTPEATVPLMRSGHAVELPTVFAKPEQGEEIGERFDETFSRIVRATWVQFAKTGNPSLAAETSPDGRERVWPAYDSENRYVMCLDEDDVHAERESERQMVDWDRCFFLTDYYCI